MGIVIKGVAETIQTLERIGKTTSKKELAMLREETVKLVDIAKQMAPVDTHDLENAIVKMPEEGGGMNGRKVIVFGVDSSLLNLAIRKGFNYANRIHEYLPGLGEKSKAKQSRSKYRVGSGFLTRAVDERRANITALAKKIARDVIRKRGR